MTTQSEIEFTHARCGGVLLPERQAAWRLQQRGDAGQRVSHKPVIRGEDLLYRCQRCRLIGVLTERVDSEAL